MVRPRLWSVHGPGRWPLGRFPLADGSDAIRHSRLGPDRPLDDRGRLASAEWPRGQPDAGGIEARDGARDPDLSDAVLAIPLRPLRNHLHSYPPAHRGPP